MSPDEWVKVQTSWQVGYDPGAGSAGTVTAFASADYTPGLPPWAERVEAAIRTWHVIDSWPLAPGTPRGDE